ncbi:hypothetical protein ACFSQ7_48850 [Paenibacillus rhizoplanae]
MDYKVTVDFAPIYECITSLNAFIGKQNHTAMDAGTSWVRQVQTQFAPCHAPAHEGGAEAHR